MEATKETPLATYSSLKRLFQNATEYWAMDCERVARDKYGYWVYYGKLEKNAHHDGRLRWYRVDVDSQELKVISAGSRSKVCPSASSTPTSPPTPSSTRLGSRATTRSWESTSSPRRAGQR